MAVPGAGGEGDTHAGMSREQADHLPPGVTGGPEHADIELRVLRLRASFLDPPPHPPHVGGGSCGCKIGSALPCPKNEKPAGASCPSGFVPPFSSAIVAS